MSETVVILITAVVFVVVMSLGFYIHSVLLAAGVVGIILLAGPGMLEGLLGSQPYSRTATYSLSTVPMFVLMAQFVLQAGIVNDVFEVVNRLSRRRRGVMSTLTLVLPSFTTSTAGGTFTTSQLAFGAIVSLTLWLVFIFSQTVRHRGYFLPVLMTTENLHGNATQTTPSTRQALMSLVLLLFALVAVVGLAESLAPSIENTVGYLGLPQVVIGIVIALLVLMPETVTAIRAARSNRLQTSINLALGSGLASIGLTIPIVALIAVVLGLPLELGLGTKEIVLLFLTFIVATLTLVTGRSTIMQGAVHLVIFASFLFLSIVP